jgi:hypothetical protein
VPKVTAGMALSSSISKDGRQRAGALRAMWGLRDSNLLLIRERVVMTDLQSEGKEDQFLARWIGFVFRF